MKNLFRIIITLLFCLNYIFLFGQNVDTKFEYSHSIYDGLTIENSFPKGGLRYTAPNGSTYIYAVFWTRITNNTTAAFNLSMNFPDEAFNIPNTFDNSFRLYLPESTMTTDKESLPNYGLDLVLFLDKNFNKPSQLIKIIAPSTSQLFYVVILFDKGVEGVVRTRLELLEQQLCYTVNDVDINCGQLIIKD